MPQLVLDFETDRIRGSIQSMAGCPVDASKVALMVTHVGEKKILIVDTESGEYRQVKSGSEEQDEFSLPTKAKDGELDWCPIADPQGRLWFVFVGHGDGEGTNLYLSYHGSSEVWRITEDLRAAGWPRWSPDGKKIAFHAAHPIKGGGRIYLIEGIDAFTAQNWPTSREFAHRMLGVDLPAAYPDWSPDGRHLAFSMEISGIQQAGGELGERVTENWGIAVLSLSKSNQMPAVVTRSLDTEDEWQPRWSPTGDYVAFHVTHEQKPRGSSLDQVGSPEGRRETEIKVTRLIENDCSIIKGIVQEGTFPIARNVYTDPEHGPAWGPAESYTIVYIPAHGPLDRGEDQSIQQPIRYMKLIPWMAMNELSSYDFPILTGFENHRFAWVDPRGGRVLFVLSEGVDFRLYQAAVSGDDFRAAEAQSSWDPSFAKHQGRSIERRCCDSHFDPRCSECWYLGGCDLVVLPVGYLVKKLLEEETVTNGTKDLLGSPQFPDWPTSGRINR